MIYNRYQLHHEAYVVLEKVEENYKNSAQPNKSRHFTLKLYVCYL